jgi:hypothetical protein
MQKTDSQCTKLAYSSNFMAHIEGYKGMELEYTAQILTKIQNIISNMTFVFIYSIKKGNMLHNVQSSKSEFVEKDFFQILYQESVTIPQLCMYDHKINCHRHITNTKTKTYITLPLTNLKEIENTLLTQVSPPQIPAPAFIHPAMSIIL